MRSDKIRILNFDDSVARQPGLVEKFSPAVVDLTAVGPRVRLWADDKIASNVAAALDPEFRHAVTFLGSGDFHHVTSLLLEQFTEPITLIVFDHHPDWDILPPRLGCGSWVTRALKRPNIRKAILFGMASDDISTGSIQTGNLQSLRHNRLEIYPYAHPPTTAFLKRVPTDNVSVKVQDGIFRQKIFWHELKGGNLSEFFFELLSRLPTKKVYVSIDKDCLPQKWSLTNWEEGRLPLPDFLFLLKLIRENLDIVGLDIVGDYSPVKINGRVKNFFSRLDHPKQFSAAQQSHAAIQKVNERLNQTILETLAIGRT